MSDEEKINQQNIEPENSQQTNEAIPSAEQGETPIEKSDPLTIHNSPLTINPMEIHHPHHVTNKKKWGEYVLEFLMLFLAVFLGFVAENIRENQVEKEREMQYIESLVADLKSDQLIITQHMQSVQNGLTMMDSMINVLNNPLQLDSNTGNLYYWARLSPRLNPLSTSSRTFDQLKNSGNFRLIKNMETSNMIMGYYEKFPVIRLLESINETEFTEYKKVAAKIFDPAQFLKMEGNNDEIKRITFNPPLRNTDKELLQELSAFSVYMHGTKKGIIGNDQNIKSSGAALLDYLQKEYHLE